MRSIFSPYENIPTQKVTQTDIRRLTRLVVAGYRERQRIENSAYKRFLWWVEDAASTEILEKLCNHEVRIIEILSERIQNDTAYTKEEVLRSVGILL